jgi:hypothetical protein
MTIPTFTNMIGTLVDPNYSALVTPTISSPNYMYCLATITMSVTKNAVSNSDGFVAFTNIASQPLSAILSNSIVFNTDSYTVPFVGVYTIGLTYDWSGPNTITHTFTFTVIDPCIVAVVPPASIPSSVWYVGDPDAS